MTDVELYNSETSQYDALQNCRPDYKPAINKAIQLAINVMDSQTNVTVADFCCGTGQHTKRLAEALGGIEKAILIDINQNFLRIAENISIRAKNIETYCTDILNANLKNESDIVLAIFAYHHVPDTNKVQFINQAKNALKPKGYIVLAEIYLPDIPTTKSYYTDLYSSISPEQQSPELHRFITETSDSSTFEFKVAKSFADSQFKQSGFRLLKENKIWPADNRFETAVGTFVQLYQSID